MSVKLNGIGNIVAGIGILILYLVGVPGFPKIPPGPIILGVAGVLVLALAARWRWMLAVGLIAPAAIAIGGVIQGGMWSHFGNPGDFGPFAGTWVQWLGLVVALVAGVRAVLAGRLVSA